MWPFLFTGQDRHGPWPRSLRHPDLPTKSRDLREGTRKHDEPRRGAAEDWRSWRGSVFPNGDPPYSLGLRGTSYLSLWSAVSITALTQEVGFSLDAGALKKCPSSRPFLFFQVFPTGPPTPQSGDPRRSPKFRLRRNRGVSPLDCGEHHRFDAGLGDLGGC